MSASRNFFGYSIVALVLVSLAGCSSFSPVVEPKDSAPLVAPLPESLRDATPREVVVTRAGNKNPYEVLGKTYHLLPSSKGYSAEGVASWYGTKFHGKPTANGELYSLYGMTAAHKTLPIPAYVKVTNLENGRTAVVRVNDRGPFHSDRLIDLSYAAAVKLGYAEKGTARVRIETIDPSNSNLVQTSAPAPAPASGLGTAQLAESERYFLQVGAFKNRQSADQLRAKLMLTTNQTVTIATSEPAGIYRVKLGPLDNMSKVQALSELLIEAGHGEPQLVRN